MEDGNVLIYVGLIVISIISAIAKARKKSREGREQQQTGQMPQRESDAWDWDKKTWEDNPPMDDEYENMPMPELFRRAVEEIKQKAAPAKVPTAPTVRPATVSKFDTAFSPQDYSLKDVMAAEGGRSTLASAAIAAKRAQAQSMIEQDDLTQTGIVIDAGDFDLRRAVVYSEILKPKYSDY